MWQFGTSAINTVVHWHKLSEVENECTSYNFRQFAIFVPKIVGFGVWRSYNKNNFACFLRHGAHLNYVTFDRVQSVREQNEEIIGFFCLTVSDLLASQYKITPVYKATSGLDKNVT